MPAIYEDPHWLVDGSGGGYTLMAHPTVGVPPEDLEHPSGGAGVEERGSVMTTPDGAFVQTLGGREGDTRVHLWVTAMNHPLSDREREAMARTGVRCDFEMDAAGPVMVSPVQSVERGWITRQPGHFQCCLFMTVDPDPATDGDAFETHLLYLWPTIWSDATHDWVQREVDLSLVSPLRGTHDG